MENLGFNPEHERSAEYGKNVEILLKIMRHGERDPEGKLTDYGREVTKQKARESGIDSGQFDAVKAIGSPAGPEGSEGMARSLETAHLYAQEIAGDEAFNSRINQVLSYENLVNPAPYNHTEIYNTNLPTDYNELSDQNKVAAAKKAHVAAISYLANMGTPEAEAYMKECAGAVAYVIDHYQQVAKRLKPDSHVLIPAGSHGGVIEFILQEALVRKDEEGNEIRGYKDIEEIGGGFDPSESYNVDIATDEAGNNKPLTVTFDNPDRPTSSEMYLDEDLVQELKEYYETLHSDSAEESE